MAFFCQPCLDAMTEAHYGAFESLGPCECCGQTAVCLDAHEYRFSERNNLRRAAVDEARLQKSEGSAL